MDASQINLPAVLIAALSGFAVGGIWYAPAVFGKAWMADNSLTTDEIARGNKGKIFGFTAFFSLLMAVNLAMFLADAKTDVSWGATAGFLAGIWTFSAIAYTVYLNLKVGALYSLMVAIVLLHLR